MQYNLQRLWQPLGSSERWTTIAVLRTSEEIASGQRMADASPQTYRMIVASPTGEMN